MNQAWSGAAVLVACLLLVVVDFPSKAAASGPSITLTSPGAKLIPADGSSSSYTGSYPKAFLDELVLSPGASLEVSISVTKDGQAFQPQQVFLSATSKEHAATAFAVAKVKKSLHVATLSVAVVEKQLGKLGGVFDLKWIVGDPEVPTGVQYAIGSVEFTQIKSAPKLPLTASTQPHAFTKTEIIHQHRAPEKRPPAGISLLFTGLALAPLVVVLGAVLSMRVNFKGFPTGVAGLAALAFHVGIAGMLALYLIFWLQLNIVQTLPLALLGGVFVAVSGFKTLSAVADNRLKKD